MSRRNITSTLSVGGVTVYVPVRTVSEANTREHHMARHRRKCQQQNAVALHFAGVRPLLAKVPPPYMVTLTRFGKRKLDKDNLGISFKHVQDQVADILGVDDGDEAAVDWDYKQEPAKDYAVRVHIETRRAS